MTTFGSIIRDARTKKNMTLKELSLHIRKYDDLHISPQYIHDIEKNHRKPTSDYIIQQLALALDINSDALYFYAGKLPPDIRLMELSEKEIIEAFQIFSEVLKS